jgi:E1-E2 ATPase/Transposase DDE domain/Transposase domain (DUF772)
MLRMLLIGYAYGIRSERQLCNEVHLNLSYRWFCRLGLEGAVQDPSTFSKNRYWRFRESDVYRVLFEEVVKQCREAGLVPGEGFAVDGSFIHGDTRRDLRVESVDAIREANTSARPVREYLDALDAGNPVHEGGAKYLSPTDPAAAWNTKEGRGKFGYFTNYMIDTAHAVIVDVEATPARLAQEIIEAKTMLERIASAHNIEPDVLTADKAYGTGCCLAWLKDREVKAHIPVLDRQKQTDGLLPREAFSFDAERNAFICPQGKILKHRTARADTRIHTYRARSKDCRRCPLKQQCTRAPQRSLSVPFDEAVRQEVIALQDTEAFQTSRRLRRKVEMLFGHMKQHFRFTRLKLRGLDSATANIAEAIAEGRGKAKAATLRQTKTDLFAKRVRIRGQGMFSSALALYTGELEQVPAEALRKGDLVRVAQGEIIPNDGEVSDGTAYVDESSITGEAAPVLKEPHTDIFSSVTAGTRVISDQWLIRVSANPGESFLDRMIHLVEGAQRQKTPNEIALTALLAILTLIFVIVVAAMAPVAGYLHARINVADLIALLVALIPTTIGALLSAIGIAGIDRTARFNIIAMSGKAVEAAGDIKTILLDKTGTITIGNRQATDMIPLAGVSKGTLVQAAYLASFFDSTPEGKTIVTYAERLGAHRDNQLDRATPFDFSSKPG